MGVLMQRKILHTTYSAYTDWNLDFSNGEYILLQSFDFIAHAVFHQV